MSLNVKKISSANGSVSLPGDKSISHRALVLGALAEGETIIRNLPASGAVQATVNCLKALGVDIKSEARSGLSIKGKGLKGLREPRQILNAQNSGTTMRLLAGLLSGQSFVSVVSGSERLNSRPMDRVVEPLRRMGAVILGRAGGKFAPLTISAGTLSSLEYTLPVPSAQIKSALLMAGLYANGVTRINEPIPSRDHTERMLKIMGVSLETSGSMVKLKPPERLGPLKIAIPGDISSAAYLIAAVLLLKKSHLTIKGIGLNPRRLGFIHTLQRMGANISIIDQVLQNGEPVGIIEVTSSELTATPKAFGGTTIPYLIDEIPILAVLATQAEGTTVLQDAGELRIKESDRLRTITTELTRLGAHIKETPDGLIIKGPSRLKGVACNSHNDHRIAMSLMIAGLIARGRTVIKNAECINESFPGFERVLKEIAEKPRRHRGRRES